MTEKTTTQNHAEVIRDGIIYRLQKGSYHVFGYTQALPKTVCVEAMLHDIPVTTLGTRCFYGSGLQKAVLPESVRKIHKEAFACCEDLEQVVIPNDIDSVTADAFAGCQKLHHARFCHGLYLGNPENPYLILHKNEAGGDPDGIVVEVHPETRLVLETAFNRMSKEYVPFPAIRRLILHDKLITIDFHAFSVGIFGTA